MGEKNISILLKYSPIFALFLNFLGAILLLFSTGVYTGSEGFIWQSSGTKGEKLENIYFLHPTLFKIGLWLIVIGFLVLFINELIKLIKKSGHG